MSAAAYLAGLNEAYGGWGGEDEFDWWYHRDVDAPPADLLSVHLGGEPAAGMAVCWRRAARGDGEWLVGILSGAWTRPEYRRRGCFAELMTLAAERAAQRRAAALVAFVAPTRGTVPVLERLRTYDQPTWGVEQPPRGALRPLQTAAHAPSVDALVGVERGSAAASFRYRRPAFEAQARLDRPGSRLLEAGPGTWAVAEIVGSVLQIWTVVGSAGMSDVLLRLSALARGAGLGLRAFTTEADILASGLPVRENRFFVLPPAGGSVPVHLSLWELQALDRA